MERRYESLGNTFVVEAVEGATEGTVNPLRRRHSFSHLTLAHEALCQKKTECFRLGAANASRRSNCAPSQMSKPSCAVVRSSQPRRTAPAGTLLVNFTAETEENTPSDDGSTRAALSTANKNDLIKSLSTMGKFALARAATLAKGAPRSSLERFPAVQ